MDIYIQSRGFSRRHDYDWLKVTENNALHLQSVEPPLFEEEISPLIEPEAFSVVLGRWNHQLCLLVAGLKSSREDVGHRPIRNSVMWISQSTAQDEQSSDEARLRILAAQALLSSLTEDAAAREFEKYINKVVVEDENYGFKASFASLTPQEVNSQLAPQEQARSETKLKSIPVERYSVAKVRNLAEDLKRCYLPKQQQPVIIVVTGNKSKTALEGKVWRGLATFSEPSSTHSLKPQKSFSMPNWTNSKCWNTIISSSVAIALTTFIFLATPVRDLLSPPCPQPPSPEILNSSRRVFVDETNLFIGDYDPKIITEIFLKYETGKPLESENQQIKIPLSPETKTWRFEYKFKDSGKQQLHLIGKRGDGKKDVEQIIPVRVMVAKDDPKT